MAAKSVIELWMWGGPSQLETFDPKPDAPSEYNNGLKAIDTNVPGLRIHEWWPELAKCADLYSVIRTMTHPHGGHETATYLMQTGRNPGGGDVYPAIGAVISMMKAKEYRGDLPPFVILTAAKGRFSEVGFLGERWAPLVTGGNPNSPHFVVDGVVPPGGTGPDAIRRRFDLLAEVDAFDVPGAFGDFEQAGAEARRIVEGDAAKTFDLTLEPDAVRDRYGRTWIGQSLLAARRLVEYGVPYVTVNMSGWDSHKRHFETMRQRTAETDRAVAALLCDLRDRGLLDSTLLWMSGEFGRTTRIDRDPPWNGGRNHYPKCFSALVAGGGFKGGCAVGESDETASKVVSRPVAPVDFLGSIYELCGIDPDGPMPNPVGKKVTILPPQSKAGRLREIYRRFVLPFACAGLSALTLNAADPYVGYIYPAGIRAGTTNRLIVGGQALPGAMEGYVSGAGVRVLAIERVPQSPPPPGDQRRHLVNWLERISRGDRAEPAIPEKARPDEWRSNRWWRVLGTLGALELSMVERDLYTRRNALQMSPSLRQQLIVTVAADADAAPGVREFRICGPNGISPPRPLLVSAERRTEEPRFAAPFRPVPEPPLVETLPQVLDGQIMPGETDRWRLRLKKGRTILLRTVARELQPYIGDAVPGFFNAAIHLRDARGREVGFADDNVYHPDPVLRFTPREDGDYTLEVHDVLYRGREDFVYSILVTGGSVPYGPASAVLWPKPVDAIPAEAMIAESRGRIASPGSVTLMSFQVDAPCECVLDLLARRAGSPLDGRLRVLDGAGRELAVFSDVTDAVHCGSIIQSEIDPVGTVVLPAAGTYRVKVEDEAGKGGGAWTYDLRVHRPAPRFAVWLSRSSLPFRARQPVKAKAYVFRRDGFDGPVRLLENEFVSFRPAEIPAGTNRMEVALFFKGRSSLSPRPVKLYASATAGGVRRKVEIVPSDEYNQAFAWDHLLPSRSFILRSHGGRRK